MGCSVAADGQSMVDYEDEFDEFGDSKCSLCQRRFEEQGKILPHPPPSTPRNTSRYNMSPATGECVERV